MSSCRANYLGTKQLLELAGCMTQLEAFVYVSTYYVINFMPYDSEVKEEVHKLPLRLACMIMTRLCLCSWRDHQTACVSLSRPVLSSTFKHCLTSPACLVATLRL